MEKNNNSIKVKNSIKYFKTESNSKSKNYLTISPLYKEKINKLHYKLYKFNEINRKSNKNNMNIKDLFSNIIIKNFKKNNYIKNLYELNIDSGNINTSEKFINTINYFHTQNNSFKNSMKILQNDINKNKFYSLKKDSFLPKMTVNNFHKYKNKLKTPNKVKNNQIKLCLAPLFKLYKYRYTYSNKRSKHNSLNDKEENISDNNKNKIKEFLKSKNIKIKIDNNNKYLDVKTEENDMRPKIRFISLKKELLEQTLKINKMFIAFNKQIKDKEKTIRFIGKHKYNNKNNDIMNNNL